MKCSQNLTTNMDVITNNISIYNKNRHKYGCCALIDNTWNPVDYKFI